MASKLFVLRPTLGQGGADRVTVTLLQALPSDCFTPSLVLMQPRGAYLEEIPENVPLLSLEGGTLWTSWWPLTKMLRAQRPDILFSTSSGTNVIAVLAHKLARQNGRLVLSERNVLLHGRVTFKKRLMLWLKRVLYGQADVITAVSQGVKEDLIARLHLPPQKIQVVYNPIVTADLPALAQAPLPHPWFAEEVPIILGVGRLVDEKDFPTLMRAFALVRQQRPCRLLILGEGKRRPELEALARDLGIAADASLPGFDKNPFKYMYRCTVFVLSSRFEGLPGVLIQAMACGTAVIATDCPSGPAEIITPGEDGVLTPVGDVPQLVARLTELLTNDKLRKTLGQNGRISAQRFRVETVLQNYVAALGNWQKDVEV